MTFGGWKSCRGTLGPTNTNQLTNQPLSWQDLWSWNECMSASSSSLATFAPIKRLFVIDAAIWLLVLVAIVYSYEGAIIINKIILPSVTVHHWFPIFNVTSYNSHSYSIGWQSLWPLAAWSFASAYILSIARARAVSTSLQIAEHTHTQTFTFFIHSSLYLSVPFDQSYQ